jgi:hypothetical protein
MSAPSTPLINSTNNNSNNNNNNNNNNNTFVPLPLPSERKWLEINNNNKNSNNRNIINNTNENILYGDVSTQSEEYFDASNAKKICREIHTRRHLQLVESLKYVGKNGEAAFLRGSRFKGSGQWLAGQGGILFGKFGFRSRVEYQAALRMRLLLSPALSGVDAGNAVLCSCSKTVYLNHSPFHSLDCDCSQWYHKHRHDAVRDTLSKFLEQHSSIDETAYKIYIEPKVISPEVLQISQDEIEHDLPPLRRHLITLQQHRAESQEVVRADIGRFSCFEHILQYIDVAVVNPAAISYLALEDGIYEDQTTTDRRLLQSASVEALRNQGSGGTAHREIGKKAKYRGLLGDRVENQDFFVPFVVEATGRLGPAARKFIDSVLKETKTKGAKQMLIIKIGAVIARNNAMMALAWAKKNSPGGLFLN